VLTKFQLLAAAKETQREVEIVQPEPESSNSSTALTWAAAAAYGQSRQVLEIQPGPSTVMPEPELTEASQEESDLTLGSSFIESQ